MIFALILTGYLYLHMLGVKISYSKAYAQYAIKCELGCICVKFAIFTKQYNSGVKCRDNLHVN